MPIFYINTHRETEREQERGMKSIIYNLHFPNIVKPQCHPWMPIIWWLIRPSCCPFRYFWEAVSLLECLFFSMMLEFSLPNEDSTLGNIQRHFLALLNDNSSRDGCFVFFSSFCPHPDLLHYANARFRGLKTLVSARRELTRWESLQDYSHVKTEGFLPLTACYPPGPSEATWWWGN